MLRSTQLRRKSPLRTASPRRAKQLREYSKRRKAFLAARPWCEVFLAEHQLLPSEVHADGTALVVVEGLWTWVSVPRATEVHHRAGRIGEKLNDESDWMAVSREGHRWIHSHPAQARAKGWLI